MTCLEKAVLKKWHHVDWHWSTDAVPVTALQSVEQLAFADIVILNKVDLVDQASKARVIARIKVRDPG